MTKKGTLGTVSIVLPEWDIRGQAYTRTYKPITPASRTISGDNDSIAPETDIATWSITDWSGGEGDTRWRDVGRYNTSDGCGPASDGSGVIVGAAWTYATGQRETMARCGGQLVSGRDGNDNLYQWDGSAWTSIGAIGDATAADILSIGAVDDDIWFVLEDGKDFRKVESTGNSLFKATSSAQEMVAFNGVLYYLTGLDLVWINRTTAVTTQVYNGSGTVTTTSNNVKRLSKSDKGPIWFTAFNDGSTLVYEYNDADDVAYVIGNCPADVFPYDIGFHNGIYLTVYREADQHTSAGDAYLWYKIGRNGQSGVAGPFRSAAAAGSASTSIALAGVIGDRIMVIYQERLWAYDLSTGGISVIANFSPTAYGQVSSAITYGSDVFAGSNTAGVRIDTNTYQVSAAQTLTTGSHDYGYLGLPKMIHTVTVSLEEPLAASGTVEVGYAVDGGSVTYLSDDFATGEAKHTWDVSTSAGSSVIGTEVEWSLRLTTTDAAVSPKVIALTSDASGAKARIEWSIAVDVGESSVMDGADVISALNALKTSHAVVQWSDPFQVDGYVADQTFDVRILDVGTPESKDDGYLFATVKFQTVGTVG